ncbi:MAG TPA: hypothetical protein VIE37_03485 [Methylomirabilota bacterium]
MSLEGARPDGPEAAAARLRLALDLFETGVRIMRQRLLRQHPGLTPGEIDERLDRWLLERPGAEFGDSPGRPGPWPRR